MRNIAIMLMTICMVCMSLEAFCASVPTEPKQQQITPRKVAVDTNYDGKPDRAEYYDEKGEIIRVEVDPDGDGVIDETIYYENGKPKKGAKDTNKDGKQDVWIDF